VLYIPILTDYKICIFKKLFELCANAFDVSDPDISIKDKNVGITNIILFTFCQPRARPSIKPADALDVKGIKPDNVAAVWLVPELFDIFIIVFATVVNPFCEIVCNLDQSISIIPWYCK
jgi:hypothetical protein